MTIASQTSRIAYTGNSSTTAFAVPFYFAANADLVVYLANTAGTQTLQVLGTNYTLTGATLAAGGTCTFVTAPTTGYTVTIYRDPAMTQTTSYSNNDPFPAASHELALDKALTISQRTRDLVARAIHQPDGEAAMTTELASVATRKNKLLAFDTNGALTYAVGPTFVGSTATGVAEVDSRATAAISTFAVSVNVIVTRGQATPGDGGGATYIRGISSSPGAFLDGGGTQYWGKVGDGTGAVVVDTRATAAAKTYGSTVNVIITLGRATAGDGGGATYTRGISSSTDAFLDAGGTQYWGKVGDGTGAVVVDTRATAATKLFPSTVNVILTFGLATVGDGGGATYTRGTSSSTGAFLDGGGTQYWGTSASATTSGVSRGYLSGMTLSNDGSAPNTVLDISSGVCRDSTDATNITVATAYTKTTATWVVGTGNGGMQSGTTVAANTWYHVHAIIRSDTGVTDYMFSLSATAPTLPTGYTNFARIGSFRTASASTNILTFSQLGDITLWKIEDGNGTAFLNTTIGTTASLQTASVPTGVQVEAYIRASMTNPVAGVTNLLISSPDQTDQSPSVGASLSATVSGTIAAGEFRVRTNTSGQIRFRSGSASTAVYATTVGWREI